MPSWSSTEEGISAYLVLFMALLALVLVLSKLLHDRPVLSSLLPEAGMILIVGIVAGGVLNLFTRQKEKAAENDDNDDNVAEGLLSFSPEVFFIFLLPPIIFNSGYHLRRELFFRHITPIVLLAVVGTSISALVVAFMLRFVSNLGYAGDFMPEMTELLTFGALISATDPVSTLAVFQAKRVDPQLFYLVFGESVLNDAVGLVLFKSFAKFVEHDNGAGKIIMGASEFIIGFLYDSVGSPVLGMLCGCIAAYLFKVVDMRRNGLIELSVYILIMYGPFLFAEMIQLSGIVTILFTGMAARTYVVPNLSNSTANHANVFFRLAAHLAETSIFLELGMSVFGMTGSFQGLFILWAFLACLVARALNVYPIAFLYNKWLREKPEDQAEREELRVRPSTDRGKNSMDNESHVEMTETLRTADHEPVSVAVFPGAMDIPPGDTMTPRYRQDLKISFPTANMLWFSGLRGAVAYACVRSFPDTFGHQKEFVVATMAIVLLTVFAMGSTTEPVLNALKIEMNVNEETYMEDWHRQRKSSSIILRMEEYIQTRVVRAMTDHPCRTTPKTKDEEASHVSKSTPEHFHYDAHVEMTESDDLDHAVVGRRRDSLFDYGGNN